MQLKRLNLQKNKIILKFYKFASIISVKEKIILTYCFKKNRIFEHINYYYKLRDFYIC